MSLKQIVKKVCTIYFGDITLKWFSSLPDDYWANPNIYLGFGTWSLYDNDRFEDKTPFHEQWIVFNFSKPSFDLIEGKIGLGSISFDFITGGWEWEHFDLSLLDFGHAEVSAEFFDGNLSVGSFASIWSPSVSFDIVGVRIELSVEVGAIVAALDVGTGGIFAKGACLWGLGLSIDWQAFL